MAVKLFNTEQGVNDTDIVQVELCSLYRVVFIPAKSRRSCGLAGIDPARDLAAIPVTTCIYMY
jgi:hypothetical protein